MLVCGIGLEAPAQHCEVRDEPLQFGFYYDYAPISYSEDRTAGTPGYHRHRGYEADLLTALEALQDASLVFERRAIGYWASEDPPIWLLSATPDFDVVGGGIINLEDRTRNAAEETAIAFTTSHLAVRQSMLVRKEDAERLRDHASLTSAVKVGVLGATTGEAGMLRLTGYVDEHGVLKAGTRIEIVADGTDNVRITAGLRRTQVAAWRFLHPPNENLPAIVYLDEGEQLAALADGRIDVIARDEVVLTEAASESDGAFVVTGVDTTSSEHGGFSVDVDDTGLLACLNERIPWLTAGGNIGYPEWRQDSSVFAQRATLWNAMQQELRDRRQLTQRLDVLFAAGGQALRYEAQSSDEAVATVTVSDGALALRIHREGVATITLVASGEDGTALRFRFAVKAHLLSAEVGGALLNASQNLRRKGAPFLLVLAGSAEPQAFLRGWRWILADDHETPCCRR